MALEALKVFPAFKVSRENLDAPVFPELQDRAVFLVFKVFPESVDLVDLKENAVLWDQLVLLVSLVSLAHLEVEVFLEHRVQRENLVAMAILETEVSKVILVLAEQRDPSVIAEFLANVVYLASLDHKVLKENEDPAVLRVFLVDLALPVLVELPETRVSAALKVFLAAEVLRVLKVSLVPLALLVLKVTKAR